MNPKDKIDKNKNFKQKNVSNFKNKNTHTSDVKKNDESEKVINELKQKLQDVEDKLLRSLAENDNLRKRHEKEKEYNL